VPSAMPDGQTAGVGRVDDRARGPTEIFRVARSQLRGDVPEADRTIDAGEARVLPSG